MILSYHGAGKIILPRRSLARYLAREAASARTAFESFFGNRDVRAAPDRLR